MRSVVGCAMGMWDGLIRGPGVMGGAVGGCVFVVCGVWVILGRTGSGAVEWWVWLILGLTGTGAAVYARSLCG